VSRRIDERPGKELGLTDRHADVPAFQIINDTHDLFLSLMSRLVSLEYGPYDDACKSHPLWPAIDTERSSLAERLSELGSDAVRAAALSEEIRRLDEIVDGLVTALNAEGLPG
jgi:hypothetical protein